MGGVSGQRALAQWLPGLIGDATDLATSDQRVADALRALCSVQQKAEPISITTQTATYEHCLILNCNGSQSKSLRLAISAYFGSY